MLKYRHDTQVLSKVVVSKMVVSKIVETPLTVRRRSVCFHDIESGGIWGPVLCILVSSSMADLHRADVKLLPYRAPLLSTAQTNQASSRFHISTRYQHHSPNELYIPP